MKLCECGCGGIAPNAKRTRRDLGHIAGKPLRFINGHNPRKFEHTPDGFWKRVDRTDGDGNCWNWTGPTNEFGHGLMYFKRKTIGVHRLAFEFSNGPIPSGLCVRHKCDNPTCCNPAHLELGTSEDNTRDRQARNRQAKGERAAASKLASSDIPVIRARRQSGETLASIAADYGVAYQTIERASSGTTWRHIK